MNIKKFQLKWKIVKHFTRPKEQVTFRKLFSLPQNPPPSDKMLLCLSKKNFLTDIYRNIQTFAFKVLQKCSSWGSRNIAVQMFSLITSRNMSTGKSLKSEWLLVVLPEHIIFNVKWFEVRKMSNVFRAKLHCTISGRFC